MSYIAEERKSVLRVWGCSRVAVDLPLIAGRVNPAKEMSPTRRVIYRDYTSPTKVTRTSRVCEQLTELLWLFKS